MFEYQLTIGLNDRKTKRQKFTIEHAHAKLTRILLNNFNIYAFTMIGCYGCYKHDNGEIVQEQSIRIEIASDENINDKIKYLIKALKHKRRIMNQYRTFYNDEIIDIYYTYSK